MPLRHRQNVIYKFITSRVEQNVNLVLLAAFVLGLILPGLEDMPGSIVSLGTAAIIFLACGRISQNDLRRIDPVPLLKLAVLRFGLLPFGILFGLRVAAPDMATGGFLLALMPAGVAVAVLVSVSAGNVALGLAMTLGTSLTAPVAIPAAFALVGQGIAVEPMALFRALLLMVLLPMALWFVLACQIPVVRRLVASEGRFISVAIMFVLTVIIVAQRRAVLIQNPEFAIRALVVLAIIFAMFYILGWMLSASSPIAERIAITYSSGAMNNNLGMALAYLFFDSASTMFLVLSEVIWVLAVVVFETWLRLQRSGSG